MRQTLPTTSAPHEFTGRHWPLIGTVVEINLLADSKSELARAEKLVLDEIERLEQLFSVHNRDSLLRRWSRDPAAATCLEFDELLTLALVWQQRTGGAFNVRTSSVSDLWASGERPTDSALAARSHAIAAAPYRFDGAQLEQLSDCSGVNLNAIAKGFIVDRALSAAWHHCDLVSITVNAGGDIAHRGAAPIQVGIEDPSRPTDNDPPVFSVSLNNAAIATSGSGRRGTLVGQQWISHVVDPRTGRPAHASRSVTVIAPDATTADVVATAVTAMTIAEGLAFVGDLNEASLEFASVPIECWIIDHDDECHHTGSSIR